MLFMITSSLCQMGVIYLTPAKKDGAIIFSPQKSNPAPPPLPCDFASHFLTTQSSPAHHEPAPPSGCLSAVPLFLCGTTPRPLIAQPSDQLIGEQVDELLILVRPIVGGITSPAVCSLAD